MLARFFADTRGNMAILFAGALPMLVVVAALVVDEAALYTQKRQLQSAIDLAAIYAAGDPNEAYARARRALIDSGHIGEAETLDQLRHENGGPLRVVTGRYQRDSAVAVSERFVAEAAPANAVRIEMAHQGRVFFANSFVKDAGHMRAAALASADPQAAFSIGSRLASLDGGIANAVLGQVLGTTISLSVADYDALLNAEVRLLDFLDALAGEIGITAGTYRDVLNADVSLGHIAAALGVASDGRAVSVFADLAGVVDDAIIVDMARVIVADGLAYLGIASGAGVDARLDALQLLSAAALVADGTHQIDLALSAGVPGLTGIEVKLAVGEPPQGGWFTLGPAGSFVRTAQVRLFIDIAIVGHGGGLLGVLDVKLPLYAELAYAEAQLDALTCAPGRPSEVQAIIAARPGVLRLGVGRMDPARFSDTSQPLSLTRADIVRVAGLARVSAYAMPDVGQIAPAALTFTHADIISGRPKTVATTTPVQSLVRSLLGNLDLRIELLGSNLLSGLLSGLTGTLEALLTPVAPAIDSTLTSVLGALGLSVGEADVWLNGLDCRSATLVQ